MKNPIVNTTAKAATPEGARDFLMQSRAHSLIGESPSQAVENQEAEGQRQLVSQQSRLPADFTERVVTERGTSSYRREPPGTSRGALEAAGVKFGEVVQDDPLWIEVTLPPGWKLTPTQHPMWSDLRDDKDRIRAAIFYKAAFYDRSCSIHVRPRFMAETEFGKGLREKERFGVVTDGGKEIWRSPIFVAGVQNVDCTTAPRKAAEAWLAEHKPDHESLTAYWDED